MDEPDRAIFRGDHHKAHPPGSYCSVDDLEEAIYDYLLLHNAKAKPFVWAKSAEDILTRERRALDALDQIRGNR